MPKGGDISSPEHRGVPCSRRRIDSTETPRELAIFVAIHKSGSSRREEDMGAGCRAPAGKRGNDVNVAMSNSPPGTVAVTDGVGGAVSGPSPASTSASASARGSASVREKDHHGYRGSWPCATPAGARESAEDACGSVLKPGGRSVLNQGSSMISAMVARCVGSTVSIRWTRWAA